MPLSSTTAVCSLALLMVAVITNCVAGCVWWVPVVTPSRRRGRDFLDRSARTCSLPSAALCPAVSRAVVRDVVAWLHSYHVTQAVGVVSATAGR
jgi:hypothetical protein